MLVAYPTTIPLSTFSFGKRSVFYFHVLGGNTLMDYRSCVQPQSVCCSQSSRQEIESTWNFSRRTSFNTGIKWKSWRRESQRYHWVVSMAQDGRELLLLLPLPASPWPPDFTELPSRHWNVDSSHWITHSSWSSGSHNISKMGPISVLTWTF